MAQKTERPGETARHLAEGEAALVLLESVLLTLVGKGVLTADEVISSVESVVDVKRQMAADGASPELSTIAAGILVKVANSIAAAGAIPLVEGEPRRSEPAPGS
jgi:hypothetical protein